MQIGSMNDSAAVKAQYATHITDMEELVIYLRSLTSFNAILDLPEQKIREILEEHEKDGAIDLPKEYGTFICR